MRSVLVPALALGLLACQLPPPRGVGGAGDAATARSVVELGDGELLHVPTGFHFPELAGSFRRVDARAPDPGDLALRVTYRDLEPGCATDAAFTLYPVSRARVRPVAAGSEGPRAAWLDRELGRARTELQSARPGLVPLARGWTATPVVGGRLEGPFARLRGRGDVVELQLYLYEDAWFLEFELTSPERCAEAARERIAVAVAKLPWAAPSIPVPGNVCQDLAQAFLVVARYRDQGRSRRDQEKMIRESIRTPFVSDPERAQQQLLRIVDVVYRAADASPEEIESGVLDHCVVDDQGQAVVRATAGRP